MEIHMFISIAIFTIPSGFKTILVAKSSDATEDHAKIRDN
jgi:hypothetical protein